MSQTDPDSPSPMKDLLRVPEYQSIVINYPNPINETNFPPVQPMIDYSSSSKRVPQKFHFQATSKQALLNKVNNQYLGH